MAKRLSDLPPDEANMERVRRKLNNARREIRRAVASAAEVDDQIGLRRGHKAEMLRLATAVKEAADDAVKQINQVP